MDSNKHPNRLINENSLYLRQHAYNPVDWYPWGEEALTKAKNENKPVLISIGYSSCHWCHVMERECFESPEVAEVMNELYVCIKIDREERPDIDQIYMEALQTMNLRGGWPLNVFLTPEAKPFYGGTYFPKAQWLHLLKEVARAFRENRKELEESAEAFSQSLTNSEVSKYNLTDINTEFSPQELDKLFQTLERHFDTRIGGLDKAPKFPMPGLWVFLLRYHHFTGNNSALRQALLTADRMAMGGLYDQIGGGFARYSTDTEWFAPHFEKMLYDNGQLLSLYSEAYTLTKDTHYRDIIYGTVTWIKNEMTDSDGGFYSSLDADSEGEEGKFYIYTFEEIESLNIPDKDLLKKYYNISEEGNWEHGYNILYKDLSDAAFSKKHNIPLETLRERVKEWKKNIFDFRSKRERPGLDTKILAAWNGIMLKGLTDAYRATGDEEILELGLKNASFLSTNLIKGNTVLHSFKEKTEGFLDDYVFVAEAFIHLYQVTFDAKWINIALSLTENCINHFLDPKEEMFYYTSSGSEKLIARKKEIFDNVIPSSNAVMAHNLYHIGILFNRNEFIDLAKRMTGRMKKALSVDASYLYNWAILYGNLVNPLLEIVISGNNYLEYRKQLENKYLPHKILAGGKDKANLPVLKGKIINDGKTKIFVCTDKTCLAPVESVELAMQEIEK
ncbi:MAG: thioredoxin domain-containing protein [Cytophagaceae bacterium]